MTESFVSLNVYNNINNTNNLLNKDGIPLLFYCNDINVLHKQLLEDLNFREFINKNCFLPEIYENTYISYFYFILENEEYYSETINIQNLIPFSKMNNIEINFYKVYIKGIFENLYRLSFKTQYDDTNMSFDIDNILIDIYTQLKNKYKEKITKITLINYVRSELQKTNLLTDNINWIIIQLENILEKDI